MIKKAFAMKIYPDQHEEYQKRHDELWPEMRDDAEGARRQPVFDLPKSGDERIVRLSRDRRRRTLERDSRHRHQPEMVALHGRHHGDQSG